MPNNKDLTPEQQVELRFQTIERHNKDAAERINEFNTLIHGLAEDMDNMANQVAKLVKKMSLLIPEVHNCPSCGRKVNIGARKCGLCGHEW